MIHRDGRRCDTSLEDKPIGSRAVGPAQATRAAERTSTVSPTMVRSPAEGLTVTLMAPSCSTLSSVGSAVGMPLGTTVYCVRFRFTTCICARTRGMASRMNESAYGETARAALGKSPGCSTRARRDLAAHYNAGGLVGNARQSYPSCDSRTNVDQSVSE